MEIMNLLYHQMIVDLIKLICTYKASVAPLIFYAFFLHTVVTCLLIVSLISQTLLAYESKNLVVFTCLVSINVPHFLHFQQPLSFQRWDTISSLFTFTDVSVIITTYLSIMFFILYTYFASRECKGNKIEKESQKRLYIWFALNITCLLALCAMVDGGSILELARWLKYDDLANFLKQEPILCHIFLLAGSSIISKILLAFYDGYQYIKNRLITEKGITTFKVVHLTLFSFLPILFFGLFLGQPWPVVAKVYLYQFSWFIKSLSYDQMVFVGTVMVGFLLVISVIVGRQVREKAAKELWEYLVGLVFGIFVALRLDYLLLMILDASFVNNLVVVLANLGILVTIPLETLPMRMFQITTINKFDHIPEFRDIQVRAQKIFRDRIPSQKEQGPVMCSDPTLSILEELDASQQAGGVNPTLRGQSSLDEFPPRPQREEDFIESAMSINNFPLEYRHVLPSKTGSLAPLRWAIDDMSHRMKRPGLSIFIPKMERIEQESCHTIFTIQEINRPTSSDLWSHLIGAPYPIIAWDNAKKEVNLIEQFIKYNESNNNFADWGHNMKIVERKNILFTDVYLTVLLQGRIPENLSSLSENVQEKVKQIIAELENSPNLPHHILFRERLANVTDIIFSKGQGSLAHAIEIPIGSKKWLPLLPFSLVEKPLALQSLAIFKSMYDGTPLYHGGVGYSPIYDSIISMDDFRYTRWLYGLRHFDFDWLEGQTNILQIPKKIVATDIMVQRGYHMDLSVVDSQLGPEGQLGMLNQILTTLNESAQLEQDLGKRGQVKDNFKKTVLQQKKWIKTFLKYEIAVFDKSHCKEWVERLNECNKKQLQSINDCRQKRIIQLTLLEKGMGDLLGDVIENRVLKLKLVPVLKEIVNQLRSSQTGTAMDLSTP